MSEFSVFKKAVQKQFEKIGKGKLFITDVPKDLLWETYLQSFPEGSNKLFRSRSEYDCQCCKQFIRTIGNVVAINDNKVISLWDIVDLPEPCATVSKAMAKLVKSYPIVHEFLHNQNSVGVNKTIDKHNPSIQWEHFYVQIPKQFVKSSSKIGELISSSDAVAHVFLRSLQEITKDAVETVLELIAQNSLYRGAEHRSVLEAFLIEKSAFEKVPYSRHNIYKWAKAQPHLCIRNTVIGSLLTDLSDGKPLEVAVASFESKVAPLNYKRPTALITPRMIEEAKKKVTELGIESALHRRFAVKTDIEAADVLFVDRSGQVALKDAFDMLDSEIKVNIKSLSKIEEVSINTFINQILPTASKVEVLVESKHKPNLVSLVTVVDKDAPRLFYWNNPLSWAYNGDVTDSIVEKVKAARGNVDGKLVCSLAWYNTDDLDLHCVLPNQVHCYFGNKMGLLDVDMNASGLRAVENPVENIAWADSNSLNDGLYKFYVKQYSKRSTKKPGFDIRLKLGEDIYHMHHEAGLADGAEVEVARVFYSKKNGFKILSSLKNTSAPYAGELWGLPTSTFVKAEMITFSPNVMGSGVAGVAIGMDEVLKGNEHVFFFLEGCKNPDSVRGFYNEFLRSDLRPHRKVFELLGSKLMAEKSEEQLSGIGFSTTKRDSVCCRITGSFTRTIKINF